MDETNYEAEIKIEFHCNECNQGFELENEFYQHFQTHSQE